MSEQSETSTYLVHLRNQIVDHLKKTQPSSTPDSWHGQMLQDAIGSFSTGSLGPLFPGGGTTGSIFLISSDRKWIVKSLRKNDYTDEPAWLQQLWPKYLQEMNSRAHSLLPRLVGFVHTEAIPELKNNADWIIMRNVNSAEVRTGCKVEGVFACDMKGFAQLYQRCITDFFRVQGSQLEVSSLIAQDPEFSTVWAADVKWLSSFKLVDYSFIVFQYPCTSPGPTAVEWTKEGVSFQTAEMCYSCAFIDMLSVLEGSRIQSSDERGVLYKLPVGKFTDYGEQMLGLLRLLGDTKLAATLGSSSSVALSEIAQLAKSGKSLIKITKAIDQQINILNAAEDKIKIRLLADYCFAKIDTIPVDRLKMCWQAHSMASPKTPLLGLMKDAGVPENTCQALRKALQE